MPTPEEEAATKAADDLKAKTEADAKAKAEADKTQEKKFTQAELDAIISDRLKRSEEKTAKEQAAAKQKADEEAAAKNGEWQKLAEEREKKAAQLEQDAATARAELAAERVKNATIAAAGKYEFGADGKMKFINPEKAYTLIKAENPTIEAAAIPDALKALAKSDPWMLEPATQQQQRVTTPAQGKQPTTNTPPATGRPAPRTRY